MRTCAYWRPAVRSRSHYRVFCGSWTARWDERRCVADSDWPSACPPSFGPVQGFGCGESDERTGCSEVGSAIGGERVTGNGDGRLARGPRGRSYGDPTVR
jgi:hypothetical protein